MPALGNDGILQSIQSQIDEIDRQIDDLEIEKGDLLNEINRTRGQDDRRAYLAQIQADSQRLALARKPSGGQRW